MKAIIMAGGEGSRLRPLTCGRPKPMVPVLNRPCIDHIIDLLHHYQIDQVGVTLQYLPDAIREHCGDGRSYGVDLHYFLEEQPLGTAGSVKNAAAFLDETFVVISGDALTDCNLQEAMDFHRAHGALATLVLTSVPCPLEYGVVMTDGDGKISRFLEKPGWGEVFSDTVNTGIYILEPAILEQIETGRPVDFSRDLYPRLLSAGEPLYAYVTDSYWCDIGNVEQYLQAHYDLLGGKTGIAGTGIQVLPGIWVDSSVVVPQNVQFTAPVTIGAGCCLEASCRIGPLVVLGRGVHIGLSASIKRSVVWDQAWVGNNAQLRGAVVCEGARVKAGASLFEGAVVGDRSVIGERSVVKSGVKIWPEKWVEQCTRLVSSLVWGSSARPHIFGARGIVGDLMTEINPDFAGRIGAAVGSIQILPARLAVGTDGFQGSQMVKHAIISGLMATGVQVSDLGKVTLPAQRYGIRSLSLQGGVHICHRGEGKINLRFLNARGAEYSRSEQRLVEGLLGREEYRYVGHEQIPVPEYLQEISGAYLGYLLSHLDLEITRRARLKVVVDYDPERLGSLLPQLFEGLGCQLVTFATPRKPAPSWTDMLQTAEQFGDIVREQNAHFGAVLDCGGEEMVLFDEQGAIVQEDRLTSLMALIILSCNQGATLALPVTVPGTLEELAQRYGGRIRRTKTAPWAMMNTILDEEIVKSQSRYPQFLLFNDALAKLGVITGWLAGQDQPLSALFDQIPGFSTARREVEVTWSDKGKVLRSLAVEAGGKQMEMIEGIRLQDPQGTTLVLPDADEPLCRVYSEAFNQEVADSLTDMYVQKIRGFCQPHSDPQNPQPAD
jgi:mannose-1-phosphate guanylyltransferase/phosphomannomutase